MNEEDTLIEVEDPSEVKEEEEKKNITSEEEKVEIQNDPVEPSVRTSVLSELEYNSLSKTLGTIKTLKESLKDQPNQDAADQVNLLEVSIWDDLVKKFGFSSVEVAQGAGYTFGLRKLHVVECAKK